MSELIKLFPTDSQQPITLFEDKPRDALKEEQDMFLQDGAGIEPTTDLQGARDMASLRVAEQDEADYYAATEDNLTKGLLTPQQAVDNSVVFNEEYRKGTGGFGLERAFLRRQEEDAINNNGVMYDNAVTRASRGDDTPSENSKALEIALDNFGEYCNDTGGFFTELEPIVTSVLPFTGELGFELSIANMINKPELAYSTSEEETNKILRQWAIDNIFNVSPEEAEKEINRVRQYMVDNEIPVAYKSRFFEEAIKGIKPNNFWGALNVAGYLGGAISKAIKSADRLFKASKKVGDMAKAETIVADAINNGVKSEAVLEQNLVTAFKPGAGNESSSIGKSDVVENMFKDQQFKKIIDEGHVTGKTDGLTPDEKRQNAIRTLENETGITKFSDVNLIKDEAGAWHAQFLIGGGAEGKNPLADSEEARKLYQSLGLPHGGSRRVVDADGGKYVLYEVPVTADFKVEEDVVKGFRFKGRNFWKAFFGHSKQTGEAYGKVAEAQRKEAAMIRRATEYVNKTLNKLDKEDEKLLNQIVKEGQKGLGKDFTKEELVSEFGANQKVQDAYFMWKKAAGDFDYTVKDMANVRDWNADGYSLYQNKYVAKKINPNKISEQTLHSGSIQNIGIYEGDNLLEDLKSGEYILLQKSYKKTMLDDALEYPYVLIRKSEELKSRIPFGLTPYQPGGIRKYQNGIFFIKQGVSFSNMNGWPRTITTSMNKKRAQEFADEANQLRKWWNESGSMIDDAAERAALQEGIDKLPTHHTKIYTVDDLQKAIYNKETNPSGWLGTQNNVEVLTDGGWYTGWDDASKTILPQHKATSDDAFADLVRSYEDNRFSRGELLDNIDGDEPLIVDFKRVANDGIRRAARTNTLKETRKWWQDTFSKNFGDLVTNAVTDSEKLEMGILPKVAPIGQEKRLNAAKNMQERWNLMSGAKTVIDKKIEEIMTGVADTLADSEISEFLRRGGNLYTLISTAAPQRVITNVEFAAAMGFLNPAQFLKQALGLTATMAMHPIQTPKCILAYPFIRMAYHFKDKPGFMKAVVDRLAATSMFSKEMSEGFIDFMTRMDTLGATGRLPQINENHWKAIQNSKLAKGMYFFADAGNNLVYGVSDMVAYTLGKKYGWSDLKILKHADDLALNMTKAGNSWGQKQMPLLMQWTSYPLRLMESFGNKDLKAWQKMNLLISQLGMWGVGGALGEKAGAWCYNALVNKEGVDEETGKFIVDGLITQYLHEAGYDLSEGLDLGELVDRMFDAHSKAGNGNVTFNIPALRVGGRLAAAWNLTRRLYQTIALGSDSMLLAMRTQQDKNLPTGIRSLAGAWSFLKSNRWYFYDRESAIKYKEITGKDMVAYLAGLQPESIAAERRLSAVEDCIKTDVKDVMDDVKVMGKSLTDYWDDYIATDFLMSKGDIKLEEQQLWEHYDKISKYEQMAAEVLADKYPNIDVAKFKILLGDAIRGVSHKITNIDEAAEIKKRSVADLVTRILTLQGDE